MSVLTICKFDKNFELGLCGHNDLGGSANITGYNARFAPLWTLKHGWDEVSLANTEMIIYTAPNNNGLYVSIWVNEQSTLNLVLSEFKTLGLRFDKVHNFTSLSLCDNLSIN